VPRLRYFAVAVRSPALHNSGREPVRMEAAVDSWHPRKNIARENGGDA
jgi:hypothetical protein